MKSIVSVLMVTLILVGTLFMAFDVRPVRAVGTIYIRADGSVYPPRTSVSTVDNVTYIVTGNITSDADGARAQPYNSALRGRAILMKNE